MNQFRLGGCIPVLPMLDEAKARAFYIDFLGFEVDWENRLNNTPDSDLYMQISQGEAVIHLNGHATAETPPAEVRIPVSGIEDYCEHLSSITTGEKPKVIDVRGEGHKSDMNIMDPFGNMVIFWQSSEIAAKEKSKQQATVDTERDTSELGIYTLYEKDQRHNNDPFYKTEKERSRDDLYRERYLPYLCECGRLDLRAAIADGFDDDLDLRVRKGTDFFDGQCATLISEKAKEVLEANNVGGFILHRIPGYDFWAIHLDEIVPVDMTDFEVGDDFDPYRAVTVRKRFRPGCDHCKRQFQCFWPADRIQPSRNSRLMFGVSFEIEGTVVVDDSLYMTEDVAKLLKANKLGGFTLEGPRLKQAQWIEGFEKDIAKKIVARKPKQLPTPEQVADFEEFIGFKLDRTYRYFLLHYNGGHIKKGDLECFFPLRPDVNLDEVDSSDLHNWPLRGAYQSFMRDYSELEVDEKCESSPKQMIPIGTDGNGSYVCLVLDGFERGHLKFLDHETEELHELGSFGEFLERPRL